MMSKNYEAFEALIKEAENGNSQAQCTVGDIYADDLREVFDLEKAVYWYKKAAEQGHTKAQWLLGASYAQGIGIGKNLAEAERWLLKSAGGGDADGRYTLGGYYMMMKPDIVKAKYWLEKAAEQGHEEAKAMLPKIRFLYDI
jgi:TPR repeat protein